MRTVVALLGVLLMARAAHPRTEARRAADLVVRHAAIWTGEAARPEASALAVVGERLVAVGSEAEVAAWIGPATRVLDLGGRRVVPGFNDAHTHFVNGGFALLGLDLRHTASPDEFARRIGAAAAALPAGRWLHLGSWDHEVWPGSPLPRREWIDAATRDVPVFLDRLDGHMGLANSRALALAGIGAATPDPPGGEIVRDPATGEPTGILRDAAMNLVYARIPPFTAAEYDEALAAALAEAARVGVTSVQDITLWEELPALERARDRGELSVRVYARTPLASWERQRDRVRAGGRGDDRLRFGGFKAYADGSLGSTTALFFEPYSDAPGSSGLLADDWFPEGIFERRVAAADRAGFQVSVHAIGERANALTLDLFARVAAADGARDRRFRIEHAQHLRAQEVRRFAALGVIASMPPIHLADDGRWAGKRLGPERVRDSYVIRSLADAGARLAFGTDWPVAPLDPLPGIAAAAGRRTLDGRHPDGWIPEQKIPVAAALAAYTAGSAYAEFAEADKGTLAAGKLADFVALSADPLTASLEALGAIRVELTVVGGRVVRDTLGAAKR